MDFTLTEDLKLSVFKMLWDFPLTQQASHQLISERYREKIERVLHCLHGSCLVTGHVFGLVMTLVATRNPKKLTKYHDKLQQLSEEIGKTVLVVLAKSLSPSLAAGYTLTFEPWDLSRIKPKLRVFRRNENPIEITWTDTPMQIANKLKNFGALNSNRLAFICHGFQNHIHWTWMYDMKRAMLSQENMSVIIVGWGNGANIGAERMGQAVINLTTMGKWLSEICQETKSRKPDIYLWGIGHSLGAHIMGLVGKYSKTLDRITGLDPCGPYFERRINQDCLSAKDAKLVDVIHTDGYSRPGTLQSCINPYNHLGTLIPMGTIDFYPNWGHSQPGCEKWSIVGSHFRAFELFTQSICRPGKFKTSLKLKEIPRYMKINDVVIEDEAVEMGFHCCGGNGNYFVETNEESFAIPLIFGIP